ncbi:MarR family winged helix-turn-helix transcriptional regulator [Agrobacterium rubi]|uniref:MarR family transcriptional regulator n=1 Tax=Agrobacterium rubi TaxID=28099 RepID=A0AAE7R3Y1_9HYPH|nr:MarR family transcriptional regulator [Agrobacterium rubi]NTE86596.1 MarR family transcriptional regulator [Agrobacterium rubi]NTF02528.1 MarR family transcriptional regulator [Agrobacterium rubi]NTF36773.1 MarR family transcriptional regulator [Agrobacterium rubi]OCJ55609.1 transcriptional regulator [Agrobacterium rubi]QTF99221.1 MarR family transcriptional regulator [Agrobacterium rubi]
MPQDEPIPLFPNGGEPHPEAAVAPGYLTNHAARLFNRHVDARLRGHNLSLALIGPLLLVSWKGPMLQRDLVTFSSIKQPAMVALLDKLQAAGLIQRSPSQTDKRAALIELTEQGKDAAVLARRTLLDANSEAMAGFTELEAEQFSSFLGRFSSNLTAASDKLYQK